METIKVRFKNNIVGELISAVDANSLRKKIKLTVSNNKEISTEQLQKLFDELSLEEILELSANGHSAIDIVNSGMPAVWYYKIYGGNNE